MANPVEFLMPAGLILNIRYDLGGPSNTTRVIPSSTASLDPALNHWPVVEDFQNVPQVPEFHLGQGKKLKKPEIAH